ncbi:MAG: TIGR03759 family integrating conjugative element protein [Candidatus Thiodiazotropha sp. (ex Cardiolucina cf. quadrata)]|nr:TIGR03759 family integrating conjugative element protein [Candidatus Thiodiazotropha sp. (ex Cardiolucina cf. quadrata)]
MINRLTEAILTLLLIATSSEAATGVADIPIKETVQQNSSLDASELSASDKVRLQIWQLSETEWRRYKQLIQGIRGSISPATISPIEVLGIHARDDAERQRYAEVWAHTMYEDASRILAFQHAYDAATKRLYPNMSLIDTSRLPGKTEQKNTFQSGDRLLFFTRPDCPACDLLLNKLLNRINELNGIDIYLAEVEPGDDDAVRAWASIHHIDPDWVRSRRITLNYDGGALDNLTQGQGEVPSILRRRGEDVSRLPVSEL